MDCSCDFRLSQKRKSRISDEHSRRGSWLPISKGHITIITEMPWAYAERMCWGSVCQELSRGYINQVLLLVSLSPGEQCLKICEGCLPCLSDPADPSSSSHLCCYSTKSTLGLPWAGSCLHISCGMHSFPGAWGMPCILMHRPLWHQPTRSMPNEKADTEAEKSGQVAHGAYCQCGAGWQENAEGDPRRTTASTPLRCYAIPRYDKCESISTTLGMDQCIR